MNFWQCINKLFISVFNMFTIFEFQTICTFWFCFVFFSLKTAACRLSRDSKCYPQKLIIIVIIIIIIIIIIVNKLVS